MTKNLVIAITILLSATAFGQVGINTDEPKATLDITQNSTFDHKGLLIPRLTSTEVLAMSVGSDQNSMMIYLNDAVPLVSRTGRFLHMSIPAHYYYSFSKDLWLRYLDSDTNDLPTGFERLPNMTASDFHWRLIGATAANYGTAGKYGLDASWNPADLNETMSLPAPLGTMSYNTILAAAGLTTADLGAKGINSFASGTLNSSSGTISTTMGIGNQASGAASFAFGGLNRSTGMYAMSMGAMNLSTGIGSFAAGASNEATNNAAVAMGNTSKASGENAVAIGQENTASAQGTLALGNTNTASSTSAVGIGQQNTASGQGSLAIGNTNTTSNVSSVAIGQTNNVAGNAAIGIGNSNILGAAAADSGALGFTNNVQGYSSFLIGHSNVANGSSSTYALGIGNQSTTTGSGVLLGVSNLIQNTYNVAIGTSNIVSGVYAKAIGSNTTAESAFSTAMGLYNTEEASPQPSSFSDLTKRLFVIGNGNSVTRKDALTILRNGKTGLSASVPTETLDVGVGNVRVRDINTNTSSVAADKFVVADADGILKTVSANPVNIYNANGSLTGSGIHRNLTLNGKVLNFIGTEQSTYWSADGSINQTGSNGRASLSMYGGNNSNLYIQQFQNAEAQIVATGNSDRLFLGTSNTNNSAPITFSTSIGGGVNSTEKMRITGEGLVGIGTIFPSERLTVDGAVKVSTSAAYSASTITHNAATPVPDGGAGTIVFQDGHFFGWTGSAWKQLDN